MSEGCDCTELCSMGPTCPGGGLAGLPGAGCSRTDPEWTDAEWQALADDLEHLEREDPAVFQAARRLDDATDRIVNRDDYARPDHPTSPRTCGESEREHG